MVETGERYLALSTTIGLFDEHLTVRERMLEQFDNGTMAAGDEFVGQTVSVQVDGGRTRFRSELEAICPVENLGKTQSEVTGHESQGRSKETRRQSKFTASWREPKVVKIYVHDRDGRKCEAFSELIDCSFGDAGYVERLIAMHMIRLGVHKAESITFNSDGATWIWDHVDAILARAKVPDHVSTFDVLDVYHAIENLYKGVKALGTRERQPARCFHSLGCAPNCARANGLRLPKP